MLIIKLNRGLQTKNILIILVLSFQFEYYSQIFIHSLSNIKSVLYLAQISQKVYVKRSFSLNVSLQIFFESVTHSTQSHKVLETGKNGKLSFLDICQVNTSIL
jgi:hypothetical protein